MTLFKIGESHTLTLHSELGRPGCAGCGGSGRSRSARCQSRWTRADPAATSSGRARGRSAAKSNLNLELAPISNDVVLFAVVTHVGVKPGLDEHLLLLVVFDQGVPLGRGDIRRRAAVDLPKKVGFSWKTVFRFQQYCYITSAFISAALLTFSFSILASTLGFFSDEDGGISNVVEFEDEGLE